VRRALIGETIYTIKLRHRGHRIPKERHINLYLVLQAQDVMERRFHLVAAGTPLNDALSEEAEDDLRAIVVEREGRIVGLVPPRSGLWREALVHPDALIDRFVEIPPALCRDTDLLSVVLVRLRRQRAGAAVVFSGAGRPRARDVVGVVTKRAIADAVIDNFEV
jgi:CIC family chloride channel protein